VLGISNSVIAVVKPDGRRFDGVPAVVDSKLVMFDDVKIPLEEDDLIERQTPSGVECWIVLDRGYHDSFGGLPAHYQAKVARHNPGKASRGRQLAPTNVYVYEGGHVGDNNQTTISGSKVGAVAIGRQASATGSATSSAGFTEAEYRADVTKIQKALLEDQDRLTEGLYEGFGQLLRLVRQIQFQQESAARGHEQIRVQVEDLWLEHVGKHLAGDRLLPKSLEVIKALADSPIFGPLVKRLAGFPV
jgi:hypothetical protein